MLLQLVKKNTSLNLDCWKWKKINSYEKEFFKKTPDYFKACKRGCNTSRSFLCWIRTFIDWFVNLKERQFIIYQSLGSIDLYDFKVLSNNRTIIQVNIRHPFYERYLKEIEENQEVIWFLFSSLVSAEKRYSNTENEATITSFRGQLALKLKDLLEDWFM